MRYTIEIMSPVHVGSGDELSRLDYVWRGGKLFVLDLDGLLAQPGVSAEELSEFLAEPGFSLGHYLRERRIAPEAVAKNTVDCPADPRGSAVCQQIKDVYHRPYIPGSSLKGAIRTAILWWAMKEDPQRFKSAERTVRRGLSKMQRQVDRRPRGARGITRRWAGKIGGEMERLSDLFGEDPNRDLLRALQVSDAAPHASEDLKVQLVETYSLDREGRLSPSERLRIFAELLKVGSTTELTVRIDESLFAYEQLGFIGKRDWLELPSVCGEYAGSLTEAEDAFYRDHRASGVADFYGRLRQELNNAGEGAFLLAIGWGSGWETKTVGRLLREDDPALFSELREKFRLGKMGYDVFPKTRRLVGGKYPLGWICLKPQGAATQQT